MIYFDSEKLSPQQIWYLQKSDRPLKDNGYQVIDVIWPEGPHAAELNQYQEKWERIAAQDEEAILLMKDIEEMAACFKYNTGGREPGWTTDEKKSKTKLFFYLHLLYYEALFAK